MSTRHVRKWIIAAPIIGFLSVGCGSTNTAFPGVGGSGNGGTSTGGTNAGQGGSGGSSSAGTDSGGTGGTSSSTAGTGGSSGGAGGSGGSSAGTGGSGNTDPVIDYEPVGIGDPWFFSSATDLEAFEVELTGATGSATWNEAGEVHLPLTFAAVGDQALIHFTAPWDSVASSHDPMDLTHRVLRARVRLASGATAQGGVQGYSQSAAWAWVNGEWNGFADLGSWTDVEFDFDTATAPGEVLRFGLQVYCTGAGDAELIIDDLRLEPKAAQPEPDGGTPEADAGNEPPPVDGGGGDEPDAGGGTGGTGGESDAGGAGGSGGLGYTPVGIGDPWFFGTEGEMNAFTFAVGGGASESHVLSNGEVHITATIPASGATVAMHMTTPWDGSVNAADLSGRVLRSRIRIAGGATATGGVQIFTQSGGWDWVASGWNDAGSLGSTTDIEFPLTSATDATSVQRFGMQFYGTGAGSVEIVVDDFRIEPAN